MVDDGGRVALDGLLHGSDLDQRANRVADRVKGRLGSPRDTSAALLGHPLMAAAAIALCVLLKITVGSTQPSEAESAPEPGYFPVTVEGAAESLLPPWMRGE